MISFTIDISTWSWPQWTMIILSVVSLIGTYINDGMPRPNYSIGSFIVASIASYALLIAGGFFS